MRSFIITLLIIACSSLAFAQTFTFERVIDGRTLKLTNGETVRLIGIEIPDDVKMGQEATNQLKNLLFFHFQRNVPIRLEFDVQQKDKYGRLLAYVFVKGNRLIRHETPSHLVIDGEFYTFINSALIEMGYATSMTIPPNLKHAELFEELYKEARKAKRGLWKGVVDEELTLTPSMMCKSELCPNIYDCHTCWHDGGWKTGDGVKAISVDKKLPTCGGDCPFTLKSEGVYENNMFKVESWWKTNEIKTCSSLKECSEIDCSSYDDEIKSGYKPACRDGVCRCMCFGCE